MSAPKAGKPGKHRTTPGRRARRAAVLAAAALVTALVATTLMGNQTPATAGQPETASAADDGGNTFYGSDQEVISLLERTAPLNQREAVQGYPALGQDRRGVTREDVEKVYRLDDALRDVKSRLGRGWDVPPGTEIDIRRNSGDDQEPWLEGMNAQHYCGKDDADGSDCGFVGVLDQKYPTVQSTAEVTGKAKLTYKTQATVGRDTGRTKGWSAGGKLTTTIKPKAPGPDTGAEFNFTYSESVTTTNKWTSMAEQDTEIDVPDGTVGWLDGRANAGGYKGFIIYRIHLFPADGKPKQKIVAIPARVLIQAPGKSAPMTWVKRDSKK
ncbi:hypothetical protein GCM10010211_76110 [Streptomyces albospinus]|uniref:Uncharacterized protein n=1 Tax=Streptomyces albospinus TaxID=285515 RepID=A0ABQ2VQH1_9ACTN|nr:hypothetical protein [Streptomyces albospinus]GGU97626.1 hypothetical protein GCM10010211_76110 [Streptomyces albospinus]